MALLDVIWNFRDRENQADVLKATWYLIAAGALAGAGEGAQVLPLYRTITADLPLETVKIVQRRLKEALLKSTVFVGVPRVAVAMGTINRDLKDEEVDSYGPRFESFDDPEEPARRAARGKKFFDTLWTPGGADGVRVALKKYHPDNYICNQKLIYDFIMAENRILGDDETELIAVAALITMNCPDQLTWHIKGAVRHGATESSIRLAYDLGMAIAQAAGCRLGSLPSLADVDLKDTKFL